MLGQMEVFIEEIEYLAGPANILIKKCFGQNQKLKEIVWDKCLNDVQKIFKENATANGLKVINYHFLIIGQVGKKYMMIYKAPNTDLFIKGMAALGAWGIV